MKILYLITGLVLGGAEKQLLLLAQNIREAGFKVLVVSMKSGGVMANTFKQEGIEVIELDIAGVKSLGKGYRKFKMVVKEFAPDIIHSHMIHANFFACLFKLFDKSFRLIATAHNIREGSSLMMAGYRLTKFIPDWSTNVSREAFKLFIDKKYFNFKKASYVPNTINTDIFDPALYNSDQMRKQLNVPKDAFIFFSAGRLHEQKNYQMLLQAFKSVRSEINNTFLIIAGDGKLKNQLKELSIQLGIQQNILFLGLRSDIPALINMCNCFVLSSKYEGFGLVIGEAMAMKKPVIATDCGGVKEVMGGYGVLVKVDDAKSLAKAMADVYKLPPAPNQLNKARKFIEENYTVKTVLDQWMKLYLIDVK